MVSHGGAGRLWRSWTVCKPGSVRGPVARPRGWPFIWTRRRRRVLAINPDRRSETPDARSLYDLAPGGACRAAPVAGGAVGSYPTVSPLPGACAPGGLFSVALSLSPGPWFPIRRGWPGVTRRRVSVEPGLSSPAGSPRQARPSDRPDARITLIRFYAMQVFSCTLRLKCGNTLCPADLEGYCFLMG